MSGPDGTTGPTGADPALGRHPDGALRLVDWSGTARRMRRGGVVLAALVVLAWLVGGLLGDGPTLRALFGWVGIGLGLGFVVEFVVVGGAAVRGMLRAGEAGERLAGGDVGLFPARIRRPSDLLPDAGREPSDGAVDDPGARDDDRRVDGA